MAWQRRECLSGPHRPIAMIMHPNTMSAPEVSPGAAQVIRYVPASTLQVCGMGSALKVWYHVIWVSAHWVASSVCSYGERISIDFSALLSTTCKTHCAHQEASLPCFEIFSQSNSWLSEACISTSVSVVCPDLPLWLFSLLIQGTQTLLQILSWLSFSANQSVLNIKAHFLHEDSVILRLCVWDL